jgi:hypothetical protein
MWYLVFILEMLMNLLCQISRPATINCHYFKPSITLFKSPEVDFKDRESRFSRIIDKNNHGGWFMESKRKLLLVLATLSPVFATAILVLKDFRKQTRTETCNGQSYSHEKSIVQKLVKERIDAIKAGENLPLLLPVEYIFTTGDKHDASSYLSYLRSIMRSNDDGESIIQTANSKVSYVTDHSHAKQDFLTGKMKYFSVVEVKEFNSSNPSETYSRFKQKNHFSDLDSWNIFKAHASSGLKELTEDYITHYESTGELAMANIILADLRNPIAPHHQGIPFTKMLKKRNEMIATFSKERHVQGYDFKPYDGMPQIIKRFNCETMSAQLTTSFRVTQEQELHAEHVPEL